MSIYHPPMSSRTVASAGLLLVLGCGPRLIGDAADAGATGEGSGDDSTSGGAGVGDGGPLDDDAMPDEGPMEGPLDGFDTGGNDEGPEPVAECWTVRDLFAVPAAYPVQAVDQDGNGIFELWVFETIDDGPGPGETVVYSLDGLGNMTSSAEPGGLVFGLVDGDGNGFVDLLSASFGGGGPPGLGFQASSAFGQFDAMATPFDIEFGEPFVGFVDVTGDGVMDVLRFVDSAFVDLMIGTGDGGFVGGGGLEFPGEEFVIVQDVTAVRGLVTLRPTVAFEPGPGGNGAECTVGRYRLVDGSGGELQLVASQPDGAQPFGRLLGTSEDGQSLFVDVCDPDTQTRGLGTLIVAGKELQESVVQDGLMWSGVGDFDGDGIMDALWAADADSPASYQSGSEGLGFSDPSVTDIEPAEVVPGRVFAADLDGSGRQSLVRAVVSDPDDPEQLLYQTLTLSACPD